ncbi:MAG: pilus assembly protein [Rhodospirillales bacterium]|jgi:Flp pilus assembly protein TadG|nr:pilus assembly protein [Rhodospirillales bacterium]
MRLLPDRRGAAAIELALVMPVLFVILLGSLEAARIVRLEMELSEAATTMAQLAAANPSQAQQSMSNYCSGVRLILASFGSAPLSVAVASVTRDNTSGVVGTDWQNTTCGNAPAISNPTTLATAFVPSNGDSTVVAVAHYTYNVPFQLFFPLSFSLAETGYARPPEVSGSTTSSSSGSGGSGSSSGSTGSSGSGRSSSAGGTSGSGENPGGQGNGDH